MQHKIDQYHSCCDMIVIWRITMLNTRGARGAYAAHRDVWELGLFTWSHWYYALICNMMQWLSHGNLHLLYSVLL